MPVSGGTARLQVHQRRPGYHTVLLLLPHDHTRPPGSCGPQTGNQPQHRLLTWRDKQVVVLKLSVKERHLGFYLLLDEKLFQDLFLETKFRITDTVVSAEHYLSIL